MEIGRSLASALIVAATCWSAAAQNADYAKLCAACHGVAATGTERGPALVDNRSLRSRSEKQIHDLIQSGVRAACRRLHCRRTSSNRSRDGSDLSTLRPSVSDRPETRPPVSDSSLRKANARHATW